MLFKLVYKQLLLKIVERLNTCIYSIAAELALNFEQTVVLGDTVGTAHRTCLNLAGIESNGDVSYCNILCLAGAV